MGNEQAKAFFEDFTGNLAQDFRELPSSGSSRKNFSAEDKNRRYIVTFNENLLENEAFFYFTNVFSALKLNTPQIFKIDQTRMLYVQEFLGNHTLSEVIEAEGLTENVKSLARQTLEKLFKLQTATMYKIDYTKTFEYQEYNEFPILHDLNYFKFMFVDIVGLPYHKLTLLEEFKKIATFVEHLQPKGLMIRDFQSRNIMVNNKGEVSFIDYQSAMKGPLLYDVVSFLYQAKANFPEDFREEMLEFYYSLWKDENAVSQLKKSLKPLQLIRFLQVLGAYGFRGLVQRKAHFLASLQQGIQNLYQFSKNWEEMEDFPELSLLIHEIATIDIRKITKNIDG